MVVVDAVLIMSSSAKDSFSLPCSFKYYKKNLSSHPSAGLYGVFAKVMTLEFNTTLFD